MSYSLPYGYRKALPYNTPPRVSQSSDSNYNNRKLKVLGEGALQVEPDIAIVSLGVQTQGKELEKAQQENAEIISRIIDSLNNMGVSSQDVKTQSYDIFPQYEYKDGQQIFIGYRVEHLLRITIRDITLTGEIIDQAVENGANIINNITFTVADPTAYYQQALSKALDDAIEKAMVLGKDLNVAISPVPINIVELSSNSITPYPMALAKADTSTPIQPGQMEITARIEATFTY